MTKQEAFDNLIAQIQFESWPKRDPGGQHVFRIESGIKLICPETSFEVAIGFHRQVNKNREMCVELYKSFITKILDEAY